jgi:hypothetical protein
MLRATSWADAIAVCRKPGALNENVTTHVLCFSKTLISSLYCLTSSHPAPSYTKRPLGVRVLHASTPLGINMQINTILQACVVLVAFFCGCCAFDFFTGVFQHFLKPSDVISGISTGVMLQALGDRTS